MVNIYTKPSSTHVLLHNIVLPPIIEYMDHVYMHPYWLKPVQVHVGHFHAGSSPYGSGYTHVTRKREGGREGGREGEGLVEKSQEKQKTTWTSTLFHKGLNALGTAIYGSKHCVCSFQAKKPKSVVFGCVWKEGISSAHAGNWSTQGSLNQLGIQKG